MARIENASYTKNFKSETVNLSNKVGRNERNEKNDVMLIQTLFQIIGYNDASSKVHFGVLKRDLPEPTGLFDPKTYNALYYFQRKHAARLFSVDGKAHPANYNNKMLAGSPNQRVMLITLLNHLAVDNALMNNEGQLIPTIRKFAPRIIFENQLIDI